MNPICVWFHGLFSHGTPREVRPNALAIVCEAMQTMQSSGLTDAATEVHCCFNGTEIDIAKALCPQKAQIHMHGNDSFAENLTLVEIEKWAKDHPGWLICYHHAKGVTHLPDSSYGNGVSAPWRKAMTKYLINGWRECVNDLNSGEYDIACCHWLWNMADGTQHIPAGNFLWVTSDFVRSLPSIFLRDRIKVSGIASAESRYEAEVYWGNGRKPRVKQYLPNGGEGCP